MSKIKRTVYLHSSKETMCDYGKEFGLEGEALDNFMYCCYEVAISLEIDTKTGKYKILKVKD